MPESNDLSQREREILTLVTKGSSNKEIARDLHISTNTVKVHLRNIFAKIDANSRTEAAMYAVNAGIVDVGGNGKTAAQSVENFRSNRNLFIGLGVVGFVILLVAIGVLARSRVFDGSAENVSQSLNPAEQRWQERAPLSEARKGLALVNYGGEIFAIGGESMDGITSSVEKYDPNLDRWTKQSTKPLDRQRPPNFRWCCRKSSQHVKSCLVRSFPVLINNIGRYLHGVQNCEKSLHLALVFPPPDPSNIVSCL